MPFMPEEIRVYQFGRPDTDTDSNSDSSVGDQYAFTFSIKPKILNATNPRAKENGEGALAFHRILQECPILSHISIYLSNQDLVCLALVDRPCARAVFVDFPNYDEVCTFSNRERTDLLKFSSLVDWFPEELDFCVECKKYRQCESIQRRMWGGLVNRNPGDAKCVDCRQELYGDDYDDDYGVELDDEELYGDEVYGEDMTYEEADEEAEEEGEDGDGGDGGGDDDHGRIDRRKESETANPSEEKGGADESFLRRAQVDTSEADASQAEISTLSEGPTISDETLPTALSDLLTDDEDDKMRS